jgi:phage terminase large subunit
VARTLQPVNIIDVINPQPKQAEFLQAVRKHKFVCYGGAAGGGKSYILRWWLLWFLIEAYTRYGLRNVIVGMFCETYDALRGRQISKIATDPLFKQFGKLKGDQEVGFSFRVHDYLGGGIIMFKNLDQPSKYDSLEFAAAAIDEYTKNPAKTASGQSVFNELRKRIRWTTDITKPHFPCGGYMKGQGECAEHKGQAKFIYPLALATNPGGPSHAEVKRLWIDRDFPPELAKFEKHFKLIKALSTDNRYNPPEYFRELMTLPPDMAKAYAEGDWNVFSGQYWKEWRDHIHIVTPEEELKLFPRGIPAEWKRGTGMDWGRNPDPFYNGWFAVAPDGTVYLYRELMGNDKDPQDWAKEMVELSRGENIAYRMADPSIKTQESTGQTIQHMLSEGGWETVMANHDRQNGWAQMHRFLAWKQDEFGNITQKPKFRVLHNCLYAIRTIPGQMHDKHKTWDMDTHGEDHACDAIRYFLMTMPKPATADVDSLDPMLQEMLLRQQHDENPRNSTT